MGTELHPVAGSHVSLVQALPSSAHVTGGPLVQDPPLHVSLAVHAFPSSHGAVFGVDEHPVAASQLSVVHALPSSQTTGAVRQPSVGSQLSVVQALKSSQDTVSYLHPSVLQKSVVHALPSLHLWSRVIGTQPRSGTQKSSVHSMPSSHTTGAPGVQLAAAPVQIPGSVHALPSSQVEPAAWNESDGQSVPFPVHVSATSQAPAEGRHSNPAGRN
jgi:hypothetical protein